MNTGSKYALNGMAVRTNSVGTAWADLTPNGSFATLTANALTANDRFAALAVKNTHQSQTLYVLLRAGGETATSAAIPLGPLASVTLDCISALGGTPPGTISLQGSGATTTYTVIATLARKF